MRRSVFGPMVAALFMVSAACAPGNDAGDSRAAQPTTTTAARAAEAPTGGYEPVADREPPPETMLQNGEVVPLFEAFDHARFSDPTIVDNPWLPLVPGMRMVFEGVTVEDGETTPHLLMFTVTDLVKVIDGIPSLVVWDVDFSDGDLVETELAFYAQDDGGTVWRMGEYPEEWEEGEFIDAPAWLAGLQGARAGIAMPARPAVGALSYSQGWGPEVDFTDRAFVVEAGVSNCVAAGCFVNVLVNNEFNDDEPGANQLKYFAQGIGNVRVGWRGDDTSIEELELVERRMISAEEMDEIRRGALILEERAYILLPELWGPTEKIQTAD